MSSVPPPGSTTSTLGKPNVFRACEMRLCPSKGSQGYGKRFFGFPADEERCTAWLEACGRPDLAYHSVEYLHKNAHICELHFKSTDFRTKHLRQSAIPLPFNAGPIDSRSTQTENIIVLDESDSDDSAAHGPSTSNDVSQGRRRGLAEFSRQCDILRGKLKRLPQAEGKMKKDFFALLKFQIELQRVNLTKTIPQKLKLYALNLYLTTPMTYKAVGASMSLPSEKELRKVDIELDSIMSCSVLNCLKSKLSTLSKADRYCTVCLKKIPLKRFLYYRINKDKVIGFHNIDGHEIPEAATHAYVLIARGLRVKWEQPLAYCFLADRQNAESLNSWLDGVLSKVIMNGYNVVAVVVDHEDLYEHFKKRITSFVQPFFIVSERKIFCIFDLPQLIISLRNTLMTHELQFLDEDGSKLVADWKTIQELYTEYNVDDRCLLVPKLTKSHVYPDETEKKELKYAAQVFSKSVSQALELESKRRTTNDCRMRGTYKLVELVNDVFDILNSSAFKHHSKYKNAFTGEPYQMKAIRKFMEFLTNVKPNDSFFEDDSFNCIYGLRITIMSLSIILRDLMPMGITSLVTHRFNLDAVDRFFDLVRRKSNSQKPTAVQLYKYFRQMFMLELMRIPKTGSKCDDLSNFVNKLNMKAMGSHLRQDVDFQKTIEVGSVDYRFELPVPSSPEPVDPFLYVCWYLLKKCYELHKCDRRKVTPFEFMGYDYNWGSYFQPPERFVFYIRKLNQKFNKAFGSKLQVGLATSILMSLAGFNFDMCPCFPITYLRRLFVRMRIFQIFRYNNRNFKDESFNFTLDDRLV